MANEVSREGKTVNWSFTTIQPHLPPKSPSFPGVGSALPDSNNSFFSSWPNFPYPGGSRRQHQRTPSASFLPQTPPWIDDLLNDTPDVPPKKSSHRRSSSDSVAFLDAPMNYARIDYIAEEDEFDCGSVASRPSRGSKDFDKLDEEQLTSMFADIGPFQKQQNLSPDGSLHAASVSEKRTPTMESPSTPSDHDSANDHSFEDRRTGGVGQLKSEPEVQSAHKAEQTFQPTVKGEPLPSSNLIDTSLDPKRAKRILANRQSAQRSRVRKLQYISELERSVNALQAEVSTLSPQVAYLDRQRIVLNVDNNAIKQRIAALAQEKLFKDAHNEALKKEVHRLRQLYQQQQQQQQQQQHIQQSTLYDPRQQQFNLHDLRSSLQAELKPQAADASSDLIKCTGAVPKENETGINRSHAHPRSPMTKAIGPSSCSTGENSKGLEGQIMSRIAPAHSDFRVHNA